MRILCIADIHGHAAALDKVLVFAQLQRCTNILVAGDLCFPGPKPLDTWKLLQVARAVCVRGVSDVAIATIDPDDLNPTTPEEEARVERLRACREALGEIVLHQLSRLPTTFRMSLESGGELLLVHGCPEDPTTCITPELDDDELEALLGDETAELIVCGGSHVPFERSLGSTRVIGVGSVGESPSGPIANAVLLETTNVGVEVKLIAIPLDDGDAGT